ncbi:meiotic nuclear division protein 1 homolog [Tetranychus urticae]|uniref:meiotic nuclear division protein 1 homolog n=1 Tax=Tetranychus urticae TaxID=32264 RepID=UPI00077BB7CF|nr:meiotic nuclear division protein 1 homolog [Tetranychus urticae]
MSKKTGLSKEEKARRALDYLLSSKSVFQLKELEKILPKEKGIVAQTVKDVIKSLQDDDLLETDKIGTSTYFWAFASKKAETMKKKVTNYEEKIENLKKDLAVVDEELETTATDDLEERKTKMLELNKLGLKRDQLKAKWNTVKFNNPEYIDELNKEIKNEKNEANRWTEYIEVIRDYCRNKFNLEPADFNKQFELEEDFDYIE